MTEAQRKAVRDLNGTRPRIVFLNLSKLRGEQASILGQFIISMIQQTLLRREQIEEEKHTAWNMYVDEFALFVTSERASPE